MRTLLILSLGAMSFAVAQTSLIPAIGALIRTFHTDSAGVAWTLTGYLLSAAVFTPVLGRLGDIFGKRRMLVVALLLFAMGNIVAALSPSLLGVVLGRVLQGTGGGVFPLCFGIIRDEFLPGRVRSSIGLISATAGVGGGLGLVVGGLLVDHASYQGIFWVAGAMALVAALATRTLIPESAQRHPARVDVRGALVLSAGLVLPLIGLSEANRWGWLDPRTVLLMAAGVVILGGWVGLERRTESPLVDVSTLASPPVLITNLATLLTGFGMFGSFILIPQLAEAPASAGYGFGASATTAGLLILPGTLMMLVIGPLSGVLGERLGSRIPLALGGLVSALGLLLLGLHHDTQLQVLIFTALLFGGVGLAFAAMPNLIVDSVPREQTGEATGFNALVRSVGSSVGSQVSASILAGSITATHSLPTDSSFRVAFVISAGGAVLAAATAMLVPVAHGDHPQHLSALEEIGGAAPLAEPALAAD